MLRMKMLPLGTVIKPKWPKPGWEDMRYIITGYFPYVAESDTDYDYTITPWPLGAIKLNDGGQEFFYSCNEDAIGEIESMGAISEEIVVWCNHMIEEALTRDDMDSPLASGESSMAIELGELTSSLSEEGVAFEGILPLGSVVSELQHPNRKTMIFQHAGMDKATGKDYDYCVCAWPQGVNPGDEKFYVIKHSDITAVHFRGYENALSQELAKRLEKKRKGSLFSRIIGRAR